MAPTIGLDLGGTKLLAGVVEEDGTVLRSERRLIKGLPLDELLAVVREVLELSTPTRPSAWACRRSWTRAPAS